MSRRWNPLAPTLLFALISLGCPSGDMVPTENPRPAPMSNLTPEQRQTWEEYKALALKNDCSGGFKGLAGHWKFVGESRMPQYTATLDVRGTRYTEELSGQPDGRAMKARVEGEIRCLFKNRVLMTVDRVTPEGAFDNQSGEAWPCDLLGDMDPSHVRMLMVCYFDWDLRPAAGREFEYERVD